MPASLSLFEPHIDFISHTLSLSISRHKGVILWPLSEPICLPNNPLCCLSLFPPCIRQFPPGADEPLPACLGLVLLIISLGWLRNICLLEDISDYPSLQFLTGDPVPNPPIVAFVGQRKTGGGGERNPQNYTCFASNRWLLNGLWRLEYIYSEL